MHMIYVHNFFIPILSSERFNMHYSPYRERTPLKRRVPHSHVRLISKKPSTKKFNNSLSAT